MPTVTVSGFAAHDVALTPGVETIVELDIDANYVEVATLDATARVYFTVDGSTAVVGGAHTYFTLPGTGVTQVGVPAAAGLLAVHLISTAAATVAVTGT